MGSDYKISSGPLINEGKKTQNSNETLETFTSVGFKMLIEATKKSNNLPFGKSRDLYECHPSFHDILEKQADYVLSVLSTMMKHTNCRGCIKKRDDEDRFEMIVESNDALLENVGITLDELSGIVKNPEAKFITKTLESLSGSWNTNKGVINKGATLVLNRILSQTKNIEKPQLKFKDKVNNDSNTPFEPRIKYKYNMLKPLAFISERTETGLCQFSHPYEYELEKFKPLQEQMVHQPPVLYKPLKETNLVLVTSPQDVIKVVDDLEKYKEIAVDLEHHSYRSFQGFTCLMQISTRDTDYIIDALPLRSDLELLNKIFTNPSIVKVFHGADMDVLWLQRDLSLYVVNMFDTHQAAKVLNFPKLSLSYLLAHYCNVDAQKQYKLADWRIRPLPHELVTYAREDTHYLLFIYDNMRNALIEKANYQTNLLESVISESTRICLKRYFKPIYETDGYLDLYHRSKKLFDNRQKFALQKLFEWRDTVARESDESYAYVFPDHMMLNVSEVLPREVQGILACCNPIPVPVRQNVLALHQMILKAREQPLIKPVLEEQRLYRYTASTNSFDNPLQCPHDLNHEGEIRDDLPVLFSGGDRAKSDDNSLSSTTRDWPKPVIDVFENVLESSEKDRLQLVAKRVIHLTPYHRYKLSKIFSESIEVKCLNKNGKHDLKQGQENTSSRKKVPGNFMDETSSESIGKCEKDVDDLALSEEKALCGYRINSNSEKQMMRSTKRKIEGDKDTKPKKQKEETGNIIVNPHKEKNHTEVQEKKKKKKILVGKRVKEFEAFNYNSVDFRKYKNPEISSTNNTQRKCKIKRKLGKKNLKISV